MVISIKVFSELSLFSSKWHEDLQGAYNSAELLFRQTANEFIIVPTQF